MFDTGNLGDLIKFHVGGGTPSRGIPAFWNGSIPWASVKDFEDGITDLAITEEYISEKGLNSSSANLIKSGSLIICSRMAVGRAAICSKDTAINQDLKALFPYENVNIRYLLHLIGWLRPVIESRSLGSTVKGIRVSDLLAIDTPIAPNTEQAFIAKIIDDLDTQIRETEAIIAKLQQVKQGLLHDLLTRGVDENGELRPSYEEAPELYKPSELGWIPKQWDVKTIEELGGFVTSGSRDWAQYYSERGDLFIRIGNLTREHINFRFDKIQYVTPPKLGDGQRTKLVSGDILVSITADLGIVGVISEEIGTAYINQHIAMIRFSNEGVNARFIGHFLGSSNFQRLLSAKNDAGAKAGLNLPTVRSFPVLTVGKTEQDEIANRLDSMDKSIEIERVCLNKLKLKKSGLMEDLLTGKVRVTELIKQQQAS